MRQQLHDLIQALANAPWQERDAIKESLISLSQAAINGGSTVNTVCDWLEESKGQINDLEVRWEVDEVIEAITPVVEEVKEEPEPEDPNRQLTTADLDLVYDDPRGLILHKSKQGDRWFATQPNPQTGQSQTVEVPPAQIPSLKAQLKGSPYWVLGAGGSL